MTSETAPDRQREIWREVHHYVDVDRPFAEVSQLLAISPERVVGHPGEELHVARSDLRVRRGGLNISREVEISTKGIVVDENIARLSVHWEDARRPGLFPVLEAVVELTRLVIGQHEMTRVGVVGRYRPPLGAIGTIGDALAGRRVVLESVECFLDALAQRLVQEIPPFPEPPGEPPTPESDATPVRLSGGHARLRHVSLPVDGLERCAGRALALGDALRAVVGVADVQIDTVGEMAVVDYDATRCSLSGQFDVVASATRSTGREP